MSTTRRKKPFYCIICHVTDPQLFPTLSHKSLCRKHNKISRTAEIKEQIRSPYFCRICEVTDISLFHLHTKSRCKKHIGTKLPPETLSGEEEENDFVPELENRLKIKIIRKSEQTPQEKEEKI
jgi:hypothetical protein